MIQVFKYIPELDCFICTPEYEQIVLTLGISEWNPVVFIGRYFLMDNDFGEHIFDNWDEIEEKNAMGHGNYEQLFIVVPDKFQNGKDGPCHSDKMRKMFWTDVLKSLKLELNTLIEEAREANNKYSTEDRVWIPDLESKIKQVLEKWGG
jgi:hypothetical protein